MKICIKCKKQKSLDEFKKIFCKKRNKTYTQNMCTECRYEYNRKWKKEHRDLCNSSDKVWRASNTEKYNESQRKTYSKYIERRREELLKYYYILRERFGMSPNTVYRNGGIVTVKTLMEKAKHQCAICHEDENLCIHHKDNQGRANLKKKLKPNNNINNLQVLCRKCHTTLHARQRNYGL